MPNRTTGGIWGCFDFVDGAGRDPEEFDDELVQAYDRREDEENYFKSYAKPSIHRTMLQVSFRIQFHEISSSRSASMST